jgi:general L-amino acid transport system permease protein
MLAVIIGVGHRAVPAAGHPARARAAVDLFIINKISVAFIEVIRGVPLIVWLFTASLLLNYFLPPGTNFDLLLRVIIMVTLFASAYMAEVIRGGSRRAAQGPVRGGDALGLDYWKSMRLIILPQALKISIPGIVNTFIGLFKDTTLVVFIGLRDPPRAVECDPGHDRLERHLLGALHLHRPAVLHLLLLHVPLFDLSRAQAPDRSPLRRPP